MLDPPDVPRPGADGPSELADRVRALRSDARVGAVVLACVALAAGVAWFRAGIAPSAPPPAATSGSSNSTSTFVATVTIPRTTTSLVAPTGIVIDVVGAVRSPGVVSLSGDARVIDAIRAAGGAGANADLTRLNLAAKLNDGARVAVPRVGEPPPALDPNAVSGSPSGSPDASTGDSGAGAGPIDVNTATLDQLETLPGIGPTLAGAIVQERERNGPFHTVDDLNRVPGIGDGRLSQLRDLVTVG